MVNDHLTTCFCHPDNAKRKAPPTPLYSGSARMRCTAIASAPIHFACMAWCTSTPSAGECGRPRTVTSEISRQISGSISGRMTSRRARACNIAA